MTYKINDFILRIKKNKKYDFHGEGIDIGCEYNVLDSFVGIDGSFLIYLMKKRWLPKFFKKWVYSKTCTKDHLPLNEFLKILETKTIIHHDINYGLPFEDSIVKNIFTSHFIEHLTKEQSKKVLNECYRILKKGGILRIICPSLDEEVAKIQKDILDYKKTNNAEIMQKHLTFSEKIFMFKYHNRFAFHRYIYNFEEMEKILLEIGFKEVKKCNFKEGKMPQVKLLDTRSGLIVEAIK
ncbi:methyltransferase domain-containing protein [Candidatus Pacearchaeota archaeon]|nr:methyltransferase domain-containing protein [Candidatus Pacearchaeota archaeon]